MTLLLEYIEQGKIQLDKSVHKMPVTYHDPCNYGRKSLKAFGQAYFEEGRAIARACCDDLRELYPNRNGAYCCGAGGGAWAMPYADERVFYGRIKARQISESGAELVIAPCHNCRDQIMKSLNKEYDLGRRGEVHLGACCRRIDYAGQELGFCPGGQECIDTNNNE